MLQFVTVTSFDFRFSGVKNQKLFLLQLWNLFSETCAMGLDRSSKCLGLVRLKYNHLMDSLLAEKKPY